MEKTPHVLLAGAGANKFAKEQGVPTLPEGSLVSDYAKLALERYKKGDKARIEIGQTTTEVIIKLRHNYYNLDTHCTVNLNYLF